MSSGERARVGVLGLGAMGLPIARRIQAGGYSVTAVDVAETRVRLASAEGIDATTDAARLADCPILIVMVATSDDLQSLLAGPIFTDSTAVELVCVMSTVGAESVHAFQSALAPMNIGVVDCPVTGGVAGAEEGTLTIFAAGKTFDVQLASQVLAQTGSVKQCGTGVGDGQRVKTVNQVLATSHIVVAAEALALAERMGLDGDVVLDLLQDGAAYSWMLHDRGPRMTKPLKGREVITHLSILAKDARLSLQAATAVDLDAKVLRAVSEQWQAAVDRGLSHQDDASVIEVYRDTAETEKDRKA